MRSSATISKAATVLLIALCDGAAGQTACDPQWLPGFGTPGVARSDGRNGLVSDLTLWDPDGSGPQPNWLIARGTFDFAGRGGAANVSAWDPSTGRWSPFASGLAATTQRVDAIAGGSNATLAMPFGAVQFWNGSKWISEAPAKDSFASAVHVLPNGDVLAGGYFRSATGVVSSLAVRSQGVWRLVGTQVPSGASGFEPAHFRQLLDGTFVVAIPERQFSPNILYWSGSSWLPLGDIGPAATLIKTGPDGTLWTFGNFRINNVATPTLARWTGTTWETRLQGRSVIDFAFGSNGRVVAVVSGSLSAPTTGDYLLISDGATWTEHRIGNYVNTRLAKAIEVLDDGTIALGSDAPDFAGVRLWHDGRWKEPGSVLDGNESVLTTLPDGSAVIGTDAGVVARWDGVEWKELGVADSMIFAVSRSADDRIAVTGGFQSINGVAAQRIAEFDGASWRPLGAGIGPAPDFTNVGSFARLSDGSLVVAGRFSSAGGVSTSNIARWDGTQWQSLDPNPISTVAYSATAHPDGGFFVGFHGASFGVCRYASGAWTVPFPGVWIPRVMQFAPDGALHGLQLTNQQFGSTMRLYGRMSGTQWQTPFLFQNLNTTTAVEGTSLAFLPDESVVVGGYFGITYPDGGPSVITEGLARLKQGTVTAMLPATGNFRRFEALAFNERANELLALGGPVLLGGGRHVGLHRWSPKPRPWIAYTPKPVTTNRDGSFKVSSTPATGYSNVSFQWKRETTPGVFIDVINGIGGSGGVNGNGAGGTVSGASGTLASPTDGAPATLTISNATPADTGNYRVLFWNTCGEVESVAVSVRVKGHAADINGDGLVDDDDFSLFAIQYDTLLCSDPQMPDGCSADFNGDGHVNDADFNILAPAYNVMVF